MAGARVDKVLEAQRTAHDIKFETHAGSLLRLNEHTLFDLDIALRIHPGLLDPANHDGRPVAAFYRDLFEGFDNPDAPSYTVLSRHDIGLVPGCTGFGGEADYQVEVAYVRVFEGLDQAAIQFLESTDDLEVVINHPSTLFTYKPGEGVTTAVYETPTVLFRKEHDSLPEGLYVPEYSIVPKIIRGENTDFANEIVTLYQQQPNGYQVVLPLARSLVNWAQSKSHA